MIMASAWIWGREWMTCQPPGVSVQTHNSWNQVWKKNLEETVCFGPWFFFFFSKIYLKGTFHRKWPFKNTIQKLNKCTVQITLFSILTRAGVTIHCNLSLHCFYHPPNKTCCSHSPFSPVTSAPTNLLLASSGHFIWMESHSMWSL